MNKLYAPNLFKLVFFFIALFCVAPVFGQVPGISYNGAQTFNTNMVISPLAPASNGGVVPATTYGGGQVLFTNQPYTGGATVSYVTADPAGNLYADFNSSNIVKIVGGSFVAIAYGATGMAFQGPTATDANGNIYAAAFNGTSGSNNYNIFEIKAVGGSPILLSSGFNYPGSMAVDAAGNVYICDEGTSGNADNTIKKVPVGGGAPVTLLIGSQTIYGIAADAPGNVYFTTGTNVVYEMPVAGRIPIAFKSGGTILAGIAIDPSGNLFVCDRGNNNFIEFPANGGNAVLGYVANGPGSITVDGIGNVYVQDNGQFTSSPTSYPRVLEFSPVGGYFISPALPAGLSFDGTTGIISGTPTAASPATNYTVTAYNASGSNTATVNIAVNNLPPPALSYSNPPTYTVNTAITALTPTSSGVAAQGYSSTPLLLGSGFIQPKGTAVDALGNVYVTDYSGAIKEIPAGGGAVITLATGFSQPQGLALDAAGNVYVSDGTNTVKKIPAGGGTPVTIGSGFGFPHGVAVDAAGNVYVADYSYSAVKKILAADGSIVTLASGIQTPAGIAVDAAGNVYVGTLNDNSIKEIPAAGGSIITVLPAGTVKYPEALAVDAAGNIFVADAGNNIVVEIPAGGGTPLTLATNLAGPNGIAADASGNIYIGDTGNNAVKEVKPIGGYFISPALPAGLSFNNTTGTISGTPTVLTPSINYTITAYNAGGSNTATISIAVNNISPPTIYYGGPQTFNVNNAISLIPGSSGVAPKGYSSPVSLGAGFSLPTGTAVDASGNVYVADHSGNIKEIPAGGGSMITLATGFSLPQGLAVDAAGNIYVADGTNTVKKIPAGGGTPITIGSGFGFPQEVAVDAAGNVYVADYSYNAVRKIPAAGGSVITIGSGFILPAAVAVDASGNLYVGCLGDNTVKEVPANGGAIITLVSTGPLKYPKGLAVDVGGNVYITDSGNNAVKELPVGGAGLVTLATGFAGPEGLGLDAAGNLYIADYGNNAIKEIKPAGGYTISPALPAGLNFDTSSGIISGTPTAASPAINYTITAYNAGGGSTATVSIAVNNVPPPTISYPGPQAYNINTAITALTPTSSGVAAQAYSNPAALGSSFSFPTGVATDKAGNVYVADYGNKSVKEIPTGGGAPVAIGAGFSQPQGVAVDATGNVYVADYTKSVITMIPAGGGSMVSLGSGFYQPFGLAVDAAGNVYVADAGNKAVKKIPVGGGAVITLATGFNSPQGIAVDAAGNVYVADPPNSSIKMIPAGGGSVVNIGSFVNPYGVAVDAAGDIYVSDQNSVKMLTAGGGTAVTLNAGFNTPYGIAVDASNNVFVADYGNNAIKEIKPIGGYYITPALPTGLTFDNTAGTISGTPTAASPATNYTVTAYNAGGSSATTVSIAVNNVPPPTISYSNPQTYMVNTAITPLTPTSSGVAATAYSTSPVSIGAGFANPQELAVDASGNVYVADLGNRALKKIPYSGGSYASPVTLETNGLNGPYGVAVDATGNVVYLSDYFNNQVQEINLTQSGGFPGSNMPGGLLGTGYNNPEGLAVDAAFNVYVADYENNAIKKITSSGGVYNDPVTLSSHFAFPSGVAVDAYGNVYVADGGNSNLIKLPYSSGSYSAPIMFSSGFTYPAFVAIDAVGNVYATAELGLKVNKIPYINGSYGSPTTIYTDPGGINSVAVDALGSVYVSTGYDVKKINPVGGYNISPALPAGLSFDSGTGIISGTPTAASPATNYTITAYNAGGGSTATVSIAVNNVPPPTISYPGPQAYNINTAITALTPTSSGVAAQAYSNPAALGSSFSFPTGVATDKAGNVYVADYGNKSVKEIPAGGGAPVAIGAGFSQPQGVAVDATGNVYVADYTKSVITMIPAGGGSMVSLGSGFYQPFGLAIDAAGNVYVADAGNKAVKKIPVGGGAVITLATGFNSPQGIAVDAAGNVYVADPPNSSIKMIPAGGGSVVNIGSFVNPYGVAVDAAGDIYVSDQNSVKMLTAGGGTAVTLNAGFNTPYGIAVDASNNVFVADYGNNAVKEIKPIGGYYITPALPAGLTFDNTAGTISGTPTAASPATNYVVTAYNAGGNTSATFNLSVTALTAPPVITSFSPASGPVGTTVTINGSGFDTKTTNNFVYFGATQATVSAATANSLIVTVPQGATFSPVTVLNAEDNLTGYAAKPFAITFNNAAGGTISAATLDSKTDFTTGTNPFAVAIGDIDGDGKPDLVVANLGSNTISLFRNTSANGSINSSSFTTKVDFPTGAFPVSVAIADVDGDGKLDIVVANLGSQTTQASGGTISIFRNLSVTGQITSSSLAPKVDLVADGGTRSVVIGDIDGDGKPEIIAANQYSNTISVYQNMTFAGTVNAQSFAAKVDIVAGNHPRFVKLTDVDGDGKPDMEVVNGGDLNPGSISIFKNTAIAGSINNSSFAAGVSFTVNGAASSLDVADIDGDGKPDIAVSTSFNSGAVSLLHNIMTGTGSITASSFDTHVDLSAPNSAQLVVINDIDGDGKPDLVTANYTGSVSVYQNKSSTGSITTNTFSPQVDFQTNSANGTVAIGDLDNDGKPDVAVVNGNAATSSVSVFKNETSQPVTLSYTSPQTYTVNTAITVLTPTSSGVAAQAYSNPAALGSGFSFPTGVAIDKVGNVYVADYGNKSVKEIPVGGGAPVAIGSGFSQPQGVAVDATGNVYVADYTKSVITMIPAGGGSMVSLGSGFYQPFGLAVDAAGNVYVADAGNKAVKKIPVGGGAVITLATGFNSPQGIAVDAAGNVYVADPPNSSIKMIPAGGGSVVNIGSFVNPYGVAVDAAGDIYVSDQNSVKMLPAGGGTAVTLNAGFNTPYGIAVDASNNVFVADYGNNAIKEIKPIGGYYITPALPTGLTFDNTAGTISGTPTAASPATNYTITAYNAGGSSTATLSITVNNIPVPTLSYSSPQSYTVNTAITVLTPTGNGVAASAYAKTPLTIASNFAGPFGIGTDAQGNVYVIDNSAATVGNPANNALKKIPAGGGTPVVIGTGYLNPKGVAVDLSGNVYVCDQQNGAIYEVPAGGGAQVTVYAGAGFNKPIGIAIDRYGNIYVADFGNNAVKEIPAAGGGPVTLGAGFSNPTAVAVDAAGNVYVADYGNNAVKEIPLGGTTPVTLYSDGGSIYPQSRIYPQGIAVDASGNVFVTDQQNNNVLEIRPGSYAAVSLGSGFNGPLGLATDAFGNVYVSETGDNAVKEIKPTGGYYITQALPHGLSFDNSTGTISGTPTATSPATNYTVTAYNAGGSNTASVSIAVNAAALQINSPKISYPATGTQIYALNSQITPLSPVNSGGPVPSAFANVSTFAGSGTAGSVDGIATAASFTSLGGIAPDASGNFYVTDHIKNVVRKITPDGNVTTIAGSGAATSVNGQGTQASFNGPVGIAVDATGNIYVTENDNQIRKITPGGLVSTFVSNLVAPVALAFDATGNLYVTTYTDVIKISPTGIQSTLATGFSSPWGVAIDKNNNVYVTDFSNRVFKVSAAGAVTLLAGSGAAGYADGIGAAASFNNPNGIVVDGAGNVYIADTNNNLIREISPTGTVSTFAAIHNSFYLAFDASGNLYSTTATQIDKITLSSSFTISPALPAGLDFDGTTGIISGTPTVASPATNYTVTAFNAGGSSATTVSIAVNNVPVPSVSYAGTQTYSVNTAITALTPNGGGVAAPGYINTPLTLGSGFNGPFGLAVDASGNIYLADYNNNAVKEIPVGGSSIVTLSAQFRSPQGVVVDAAGNVYVASNFSSLGLSNGTVIKFPAGGGAPVGLGSGIIQASGIAIDALGNLYVSDFGDKTVKEIPVNGGATVTLHSGFSQPFGVAVDAAGNVYVADAGASTISEIPAGGGAVVTVGSGFSGPYGVAIDGAGNIFVADRFNKAVKMIPVGGGATVTLGSFNDPTGITIDGYGNLYVANASGGIVQKIKPIGGYYISPLLPAGLSIASTTGIISGTPIAASPATTYTVTAYNAGGSSTATLNITVNALQATGLQADSLALVDLYNSTNGPNWTNHTNWLTAAPISTWYGVATTANRVTRLSLQSNNLSGNLPSSLGNLSNLNFLNLEVNKLTDSIPSTIGNLKTLTFLDLDGNQITGNIPATLANLTNLNVLLLGDNQLTGSIPSFLGNLTSLTELVLGDNLFSTTTDISFIGNLKNLINLDLHNDHITCNMPSTFANLTNLVSLYLYNNGVPGYFNQFTGPIPSFLGNLTNLTNLELSNNPFTSGDISFLGNLTNLIYLYLDGDQIISIPSAFANLTKLKSLVLNNNLLTGPIPSFLGNSPLTTLLLNQNKLTFAGMETLPVPNNSTIVYTPQANININKGTTQLSVSAGGTLANNTYTWYLNGALDTVKTGDSTLTIKKPGIYYATVTNSIVTSLTLTTNPDTVTASVPVIASFIPSAAGSGTTVTIKGTGFTGATAVSFGGTAATSFVIQADTLVTAVVGTGASGTVGVTTATGNGLLAGFTFVPAPAISYTSSQTYTVNTAITNLSPTNSGGAVPATVYGQVSTLAGILGTLGSTNGPGTVATFNAVTGVAADALGNVYAVDDQANLVRKINTSDVVSTFAGSGVAGSANGTGTAASFNTPNGISTDAMGNVYIADEGNSLIRKISAAGVVSTFAGSGTRGSSNGPVTTASFNNPISVAADASGNVYVADISDNLIRKISLAGVVSTLAGSGASGSANGIGTAASFTYPTGVATDASGNVYVADGDNLIRMISPSGVVSTLAGSGTKGSADGAGTAASFNNPRSVATDALGNVYVADLGNNLIRKISPTGIVSTLAGNGSTVFANGTGAAASFKLPTGIATDVFGNVYVADVGYSQIRKIITTGYTISPALPAGLTFDATTGIISGTPTVASPATNYTVTAYNIGGSSTATVNITVKPLVNAADSLALVDLYNSTNGPSWTNHTNWLTSAPLSTWFGVTVKADTISAIYLNQNNLTGYIPASIGNIANLSVLSLESNNLADTIPSTIGNLKKLTGLWLDYNKLTGGIPAAIGNLGSLTEMRLNGNQLSGNIPASFANLTNIVTLYLSSNRLTGNVPAFLFNLPNLSQVLLSSNQLSGKIPAVTTNLPNLYGVWLDFNQLTGGIPDSFGSLSNLNYIVLNDNQLTGTIPSSLGSLKKLVQLNLSDNYLSGAIPSYLDNYPNLSLSLSKNKFTFAGMEALPKTGNQYTPQANINIANSGAVLSVSAGGTVANNSYTWYLNGVQDTVKTGDSTLTIKSPGIYYATVSNNIVTTFDGLALTTNPDTVTAAVPFIASFSPTSASAGATITIKGTGFLGTSAVSFGGTAATSFNIKADTLLTAVTGTGASGNLSLTTPAGSSSLAGFTFESPPAISYGSNSETYITGTAIPPLTPINTGGAVTAGFVGTITLASGFNGPAGVAVDAAGNVYVGDYGNSRVWKLQAGGGSQVSIGTGFSNPEGVAVDAAGNVYVADRAHNAVKKILAANGSTVSIGSGFNNPNDVAVDAAGNIYVADVGTNSIKKISAADGSTVTVATGFNDPTGVAVDLAGNVYVADAGNSAIKKIQAGGGIVTIGSGFYSPYGVAVDPEGNVYVADYGHNAVKEIPVVGGSPVVIGSGFSGPYGVTADASGNVYVGDYIHNAIKEIQFSGYTITPALPAGLTFDATTGTISGTPTVTSPATTYTITASNIGGSNKTTVSITVTNPSQTITFAALGTAVYGAGDITPGAKSSLGLPVAYSSSNTNVATITTSGTIHIVGAGITTIIASQAGDSTHLAATPVMQTLTVTPAALTVFANKQTKVYGSVNPVLTVNYAGFVNGDSQTGLTTQPIISTTATTASPVGNYPITVGGAASSNYTISFLSDTLTVTPAPLTITANNQSKYYGDANPVLTNSYTGFVNGDTQASLAALPTDITTATNLSVAGNYPISVSGASAVNYTISYIAGTLTVNPAPVPAITVVSPETAVAGSSITLTGTYFLGANGVSFGGIPAASFTVNSPTSITAVAGGGATGNVVVTTPSGSGTFAGFSFVSIPSITAAGPTTILSNASLLLTASPGSGYNYQWFNNGVSIAGATNATYTATAGGSYTVSISLNGVSELSSAIVVSTVFDLPSTNFKLAITSATCRGSSNGFVNIQAAQALNYTATISGNGLNNAYPFTDTLTINNLAAGTYSVCITVAGQSGYSNCYSVVVSQPQDLSAFSVVNYLNNSVDLTLSGGTQYNINLNGKVYTTTNSSINLPLNIGENDLVITTDRECQGAVERHITVSNQIIPYPVPFVNTLNLDLGTQTLNNISVEIHNVADGKLVYSQKFGNQAGGVLQLDVSSLKNGVYSLHLSSANFEKVYKILKQ